MMDVAVTGNWTWQLWVTLQGPGRYTRKLSYMASLENFRLVVFRAVATTLSFRKAAEELYLTQPAVSLQIKALEEDLEAQLFDRSATQVKLTRAGRVLLGYADQVQTLLAQAENEIAALRGDHSGTLALGASTTIVQYVLPQRLVEPIKMAQRCNVRRRRTFTQHLQNRIAGHKMNQQKDKRNYQPYNRNSENETVESLLHEARFHNTPAIRAQGSGFRK